MHPPLLVTRDPGLVEEVSRLAAAAGVTPSVCSDAREALGHWRTAPMVLVGVDLAAELASLRPSRRDGAHLLVIGHGAADLYAVALAVGAETVTELPRSEGWLVEMLTDAGDRTPSRGLLVGVVGGSGGAGASTFACALGQVAARTTPALIVDLDPLGPGLDRILGLELRDGVRWDGLQQTTGRLSARSLHDAVPRRGALGVLTWRSGTASAVPAFTVREALSAAQRGHDLVVVDLPRSTGEDTSEVVSRCDLVVVVTVPSLAGLASAARVAARLTTPGPRQVVVRGAGADPRVVERSTGLPAAITMASQRGLQEAVDLGLGPVRARRGPLARAAGDVLAGLAALTRAA